MIPLLLLWALLGWGSVLILPPPPLDLEPLPRGPRPRPYWLILRIIGMVAGVIGGWVFSIVFRPHPEPWLTDNRALNRG
jgi:hypothetical protein